ncbi:conserved hypothetical protein [Culex quinquefasciatus]|uniref:Uncharacterized protein n=1 Tax=Culex quinquefasciatus TaxID=7176 RepID=B0W6V2_CULQU|nr:conserved hypothetical protein [Culex quinquefasciatus]|eukprot:XP_001844436.1 conserved hypothetical protein [Culex quinquefasciatus]
MCHCRRFSSEDGGCSLIEQSSQESPVAKGFRTSKKTEENPRTNEAEQLKLLSNRQPTSNRHKSHRGPLSSSSWSSDDPSSTVLQFEVYMLKPTPPYNEALLSLQLQTHFARGFFAPTLHSSRKGNLEVIPKRLWRSLPDLCMVSRWLNGWAIAGELGGTTAATRMKIVFEETLFKEGSVCRLFLVQTVHGTDCSWFRLLMVQTVHGTDCYSTDCSWFRLFMVQTAHGLDCSWSRLFMVQTVHGSDCSWFKLIMVQTVYGSDCSWFRLFMIAHGSDCSWSRLFMIQTVHSKTVHSKTVHGPDCSWFRLFMVQTVHGTDCSWFRLFMIAHGSDCSWSRLFMIQTVHSKTVHSKTVHGSDCSWYRLFMVQTVHETDCSWFRLFMVQTVHGADCSRKRFWTMERDFLSYTNYELVCGMRGREKGLGFITVDVALADKGDAI